MIELTKAEEQIMQVLWKIGTGFVKDILVEFPEPKPAYNTVSTIIRILEKKGAVDHKQFGNTHQYFPLLSEEEYSSFSLNRIVKNYFSNSSKELVSHLIQQKKLSVDEIDDLLKMLKTN